MTRKDFVLIAGVIKARMDDAPFIEKVELIRLAEDMADALRSTNRDFNRDRFLRACGVDE